ncbi:MAG: hypothetical protein AUI36_37060 [Cyanobacteria bacterium 13_1_40CM_2_61_4]|nr:MAG: hypothetical protein AUI36_37060 [Cyanobacteria bacterium 13_1_40CM_2_61_4]
MTLQVDSYVPLTANEDGVLRVGGTRVTLDTIVSVFEEGETPEQIAQNFPGLKLEDVYAVITYYLRNQERVLAYLAEEERASEDLLRKIKAKSPTNYLRERVLKRKLEETKGNPGKCSGS